MASPARAINLSDTAPIRSSMHTPMYVFRGELVPVQSTGVNVYDIRRKCDPEHRLCYDFDDIE
eukprot:32335-Eustigmatos_ZCMA.PRE.1